VDKKEAFLEAIEQNKGIIYKIAAIYSNDQQDKNDLVQEIIYQLWKSFDSFQKKSSLSTWIYRVTMNVGIYHLKSSKKRVKTVELTEEALDYRQESSADEEEKLAILKWHLQQLSPLDKGIILLYLENKSYEEIAGIVGLSPTNIGTKIYRIREKLKNKITKNLP